MIAIIFVILGTLTSLMSVEYFELSQTWVYILGLTVGMVASDIRTYLKWKKL